METKPKPNEYIVELCKEMVELNAHVGKTYIELIETECNYCPTKCEDPRSISVKIKEIKYTQGDDIISDDNGIIDSSEQFYYCIPQKIFYYKRTPQEIAQTLGVSLNELHKHRT